MNYNLIKTGSFEKSQGEFQILVLPEYRSALQGIEDFAYLQIVWWFDRCDTKESRTKLCETKPYKKGPDVLGAFATRTPERPNPIAISTVYVLSVDMEKGIIRIPYTDALPGTPILDIKPYMPSLDRVENPMMPAWCSNWPVNVETSGDFDWEGEFNFKNIIKKNIEIYRNDRLQ